MAVNKVRGRGLSGLSEPKSPLRRPNLPNMNALRELNSNPLAASKEPEENIFEKFESADEIINYIQKTIINVESLKKTANSLGEYSLNGIEEAIATTQILGEVQKITIDGVTFRSIYLNFLQLTFEKMEDMKVNNNKKFAVFVFLLSEIVITHYPNIQALILSAIQSLHLLLKHATHQDLLNFSQQIKKLTGTVNLNQDCFYELNEMISTMRQLIASSQTIPRNRLVLLEIFELGLNNWKELPTHVSDFYKPK